jgi:hypothetical protein
MLGRHGMIPCGPADWSLHPARCPLATRRRLVLLNVNDSFAAKNSIVRMSPMGRKVVERAADAQENSLRPSRGSFNPA